MKLSFLLRPSQLALILFVVASRPCAQAGSAAWSSNPTSGDWNTAANWMPNTVPNAPTDVATFLASNTTDVSISAQTVVDSIIFNPGASAFTITSSRPTFTLSGTGVVNDPE
jgi:hypothetical protein